MKRTRRDDVVNIAEKSKIVIVDDKKINRYILSEIFEEYYDIVECEDGDNAISAIKEYGSKIKIMLLDIVMPTCDGFTVLKYIKDEVTFKFPVVLISSNVNDENIQKAYEYDVADYIQKPFQEDVVRERVQRIIDSYRY